MNGQQCYIEGNGQCNKIRGKAVDTHGVTNDNMATPTTIEMRGVETIMSSPGKRGRINHGNKTKLTQVTLQHSSCWGKTTELCLIGGKLKTKSTTSSETGTTAGRDSTKCSETPHNALGIMGITR